MRPIEILVLLVASLALLARLLPALRGSHWPRYLGVLAVALAVLQLLIENYRWQMVPAYALIASLGLLCLPRHAGEPRAGRWRRAGRVSGAVLGVLAIGATALLASGFPIFSYPKPTGPYGVGTTRWFLTDRSRDDPFAPAPHTPRELPVAVWYPADVPPAAKPAPFWPADARVEQSIGLPAFMLSHLRLIPSHSYEGAPLAAAPRRYPVIIFSHGYLSTMWQSTVQMEEWASHGFIVVSLGHTYDATALTFPDGRVVVGTSFTRPPQLTSAEYARLWRLNELVEAAAGDPAEARRRWKEDLAFQKHVKYVIAASSPVWVDDTRFFMGQLEAINSGVTAGVIGTTLPFVGRMDLDRLGVAGMSFGGSTAGSVCAVDPRCKAGLNFDGSQFGDVINRPLTVPFMYFANATNASLYSAYFDSKADLYGVHVKRSAHGNFADLSIAAPIFRWLSTPRLAMLGRIGSDEIERIMNVYSLAFFQKYLQDQAEPVLTSAPSTSEFTDVEYRWQLATADTK
jgi:predicted dienelactone hydrolase